MDTELVMDILVKVSLNHLISYNTLFISSIHIHAYSFHLAECSREQLFHLANLPIGVEHLASM